MNGAHGRATGVSVIVGEMGDDLICVRTPAGQTRRLWKDAPLQQRASFFDRVFAEMKSGEPLKEKFGVLGRVAAWR